MLNSSVVLLKDKVGHGNQNFRNEQRTRDFFKKHKNINFRITLQQRKTDIKVSKIAADTEPTCFFKVQFFLLFIFF